MICSPFIVLVFRVLISQTVFLILILLFILDSRDLEAGIKIMNVPSPLGVEALEEFKHRKELMKPIDEVC